MNPGAIWLAGSAATFVLFIAVHREDWAGKYMTLGERLMVIAFLSVLGAGLSLIGSWMAFVIVAIVSVVQSATSLARAESYRRSLREDRERQLVLDKLAALDNRDEFLAACRECGVAFAGGEVKQ